MTVLRAAGLIIAAGLLLATCGGEQHQEDAPAETGPEPAAGMEGVQGTTGMQNDMMSRMTAHMQMMEGVGADSIQALMPMHRQMTANMIAQMNREMRDMNMTGDAAWTATVDSLRADLTRMPEMSAPELQAMMPDHRARMMRLMETHRSMMADMRM